MNQATVFVYITSLYAEPVVTIFVKHWGDNLQFYPIFNIGGMNLDHDFVQVWKFSEDQKK